MPRLHFGLTVAGLLVTVSPLRAQTGAWPALSMNKKYPDGSMPPLFMQGAATAFAAIVLIEADAAPRR